MGDAYLRLRKYKEAIEALEKVLELSRPEDVIYEAIGHCYHRMKNYAQARFNYKKAVHLNPDDSRLYQKIASTYMQEANDELGLRNEKLTNGVSEISNDNKRINGKNRLLKQELTQKTDELINLQRKYRKLKKKYKKLDACISNDRDGVYIQLSYGDTVQFYIDESHYERSVIEITSDYVVVDMGDGNRQVCYEDICCYSVKGRNKNQNHN